MTGKQTWTVTSVYTAALETTRRHSPPGEGPSVSPAMDTDLLSLAPEEQPARQLTAGAGRKPCNCLELFPGLFGALAGIRVR